MGARRAESAGVASLTWDPPPHTHPGTVLSTETLFTRALGAYCEPGGVQTPPQKPPPAVIRPLLGARGIWKEVILPLTAGTAGHR